MFLSFVCAGLAQEQSEGGEAGPAKNKFTVSLNFGSGSYIGHGAPAPNLDGYTLAAPMEGWFKNKPTFDLEGKWFIDEKWALKLTGGLYFSHSPAYNEVTGTVDNPSGEPLPPQSGELPQYNAVVGSDNLQYTVAAGVDRYISTAVSKLYLRIGAEVGFAYGRVARNAPDDERYMGAAVGEAYSFRLLPVVGVDYFFTPNWFAGVDIRPLSYHYSVYGERPQAGMKLLSSDNHSFSFLRQTPSLKIGFCF